MSEETQRVGLYKCRFNVFFKKNDHPGAIYRRSPAHMDVHVVTDGDAATAADKAKKIAVKSPGVDNVHLREVIFVSVVDG